MSQKYIKESLLIKHKKVFIPKSFEDLRDNQKESNDMNNKIKTAALVYSRSDSTRLPRKAFLPFGNTNLISYVLERAIHLNVDEIILATTDRACDDEYLSVLKNKKFSDIKIFRGSCDNVVKRTLEALNENKIDRFCRINGDCPFFPI